MWYNTGMNQGAFARNCELLLIHLNNLQERGKIKKCRATTKYLAKAINKSPTQTNRYLRALEQQKLIKRNTSGFFRNKVNRRPYKLRTIDVFCSKPVNSDQILAVYFNKTIHGRVKNRMVREIVKSKDFKHSNIQNPAKVIRSLHLKLNLTMANPRTKENFMAKYDDVEKIVRESEKKLEEKRFYSALDTKAEKILAQMWDGQTALKGNTPIERLADLSVRQFRENELLMERLDPPTDEQRQQKAAQWAANAHIKGIDYGQRFWITIYLGGEIPHEVPLMTYLPWDDKSEYYKLFIKAFMERNE